MQNFKGKVAVITGAASGIGKGVAARCGREGMNIVLADIEEEALKRTANELQRPCRHRTRSKILAVRMA